MPVTIRFLQSGEFSLQLPKRLNLSISPFTFETVKKVNRQFFANRHKSAKALPMHPDIELGDLGIVVNLTLKHRFMPSDILKPTFQWLKRGILSSFLAVPPAIVGGRNLA